MAKSKKSRRARRQEAQKQRRAIGHRSSVVAESAVAEAPASAVTVETLTPAAEETEAQPSTSRKAAYFFQEYFYVYREIRTILITAIVMFIVMAALSFVF